ncbi:MAG: GNAT family N-acetyltransferase [Verrucomicrobiales bacterium]
MITYRQATRDEFNLAIQWAADEGWNPGCGDADIFWETDPSGFVCAEREGEVIATGSIVSYGRAFGFMGFFIVRPDLRGQGIGRDFWYWRRDMLRSRLQADAPIGMDGVFDMQPFYAKGGFEFTHRNLRMEGVGQAQDVDRSLVPLDELPFADVKNYDQQHFGFERDTFLKKWIHPHGGRALGSVEGGRLCGMGIIRPCLNGFKIGSLFADNADVAERIFCALSNYAVGEAIYLDIPENNPAAQALAKRHNLQEIFGCARMYHGSIPELPWLQIFGITTFELG